MDWSDEQQKRWEERSGSTDPPFVVLDTLYQYDANHTPLLDAITRSLPDRPPPSRYTRLRWRLRSAQRRAGDAWRVLWHGLPEHDD